MKKEEIGKNIVSMDDEIKTLKDKIAEAEAPFKVEIEAIKTKMAAAVEKIGDLKAAKGELDAEKAKLLAFWAKEGVDKHIFEIEDGTSFTWRNIRGFNVHNEASLIDYISNHMELEDEDIPFKISWNSKKLVAIHDAGNLPPIPELFATMTSTPSLAVKRPKGAA